MEKRKPTGRPSTFREETANTICERLAIGRSLRSICDDSDMPTVSCVMDWLKKYDSFAQQYARAREAQADAIFDETLHIADTAGMSSEAVAKARLQIDTRKWMAGKLRPKKYGEKHLLGSDPDNPLPASSTVDVVSLAKALREKRVADGTEHDAQDLL